MPETESSTASMLSGGANGGTQSAAGTNQTANSGAAGATTQTQGAFGATTNAGTAPSWYEGAPQESVAWLQGKGFKSQLDLIESARNAEKLIGVPADKVIRMTDKMRDEQGRYTKEARDIWEKLGAPKDPKDYQLETLPEYGDATFTEALKQKFFEEGVRKDSAENLMKHANALQMEAIKRVKVAQSEKIATEDHNLKREWGAAYEQNINIAKQAVVSLGWDDKKINAVSMGLGHAETVKLLHRIGLSASEGRFVSGTQNTQPMKMTPEQADVEMRSLMSDVEFQKRFNSGDKEAIDRWTKLNQERAAQGYYNLGQPINANTWDSKRGA